MARDFEKAKKIKLRIIGFLLLAAAITGAVFVIINLNDMRNTFFIIGLYVFALSTIGCVPCLVDGFRKSPNQPQKHYEPVVEDTYEDDYRENDATDATEAITDAIAEKVIDKIKEDENKSGVKRRNVKYCIECGCAIDKNSAYCNVCGKEQD